MIMRFIRWVLESFDPRHRVDYRCTFCSYSGHVMYSNVEWHNEFTEKCLKCPNCGFETLWRREYDES